MVPIEKIADKYRRDGFARLVQSTPNYIKNKCSTDYLWKIYLSRNSITSSEIKDISLKKGKIYYQEESDDYIEYANACEIVLAEGEIEDAVNKKTEHNPKERYACEVPDCVFFGGLAIPFHDGRCVLEPFGGEIDSFINAKNTGFFDNRVSLINAISETYFRKREHSEAESKSEIIFPLVYYYKSYYHWMVDYLPKLRILDKYKKETGNEPKILIRKDPASYRQESLELLGYSPDRIIEWKNSDCITSRAVFTNHRKDQSEHSYQDYNWLRNKFFDKVDIEDNKYSGEKIYVSRQGEKDGENMHNNERYVVNIQSFKDLIESYGFKIVQAEEYSLEEQIQLFHSAEVIMGPHGAGLTNMIFGKNPFVIELFPDSFVIPLYSYLCDTLGFEYQPVVTNSDNNNLIINIDEFENVLSDMDRLN